MARKSLLERYTADAAHLNQRAQAAVNGGPDITPTHVAAVELLDKMMQLVSAPGGSDDVPMPLVAMLGTLRRLRPILLDRIGRVPAEEIARFMGQLRDDIDDVARSYTPPRKTRQLAGQTTIEDHLPTEQHAAESRDDDGDQADSGDTRSVEDLAPRA